ncbi:MAG TPA: glycosyltransferase family 2 protein [Thermodesulfobacteriota bacterium]|nr:glycosyltransferase family 2 protein [Thermodesulfobacteriota bacterium]HNU70322.1 glycosyltransferase family 2 protein [Thermodesulfobacteriota bacterium]
MYKNKTVAVVVPAHNEEHLILTVLKTMPPYVDRIIVVNDASTDETGSVLEAEKQHYPALEVIHHDTNQGVGGSIATGYLRARDLKMDVTVVMAGDAQMDPADLPAIIDPIASDQADYTKGNRLFRGESWELIPHYRYLGNSFLSFLTKIASGYWHIADSQCGYTGISLEALNSIDITDIYKRYGMPNDLLIKLNIAGMRVRDVTVRPVYNIGERSGIRLWKVIPTISILLWRGFLRRLFAKYVIKDFHPLVLFYCLSFLTLPVSFLFFCRVLFVYFSSGFVPFTSHLLFWFMFISGLQTFLFAMWFDMEYNKDLR